MIQLAIHTNLESSTTSRYARFDPHVDKEAIEHRGPRARVSSTPCLLSFLKPSFLEPSLLAPPEPLKLQAPNARPKPAAKLLHPASSEAFTQPRLELLKPGDNDSLRATFHPAHEPRCFVDGLLAPADAASRVPAADRG